MERSPTSTSTEAVLIAGAKLVVARVHAPARGWLCAAA